MRALWCDFVHGSRIEQLVLAARDWLRLIRTYPVCDIYAGLDQLRTARTDTLLENIRKIAPDGTGPPSQHVTIQVRRQEKENSVTALHALHARRLQQLGDNTATKTPPKHCKKTLATWENGRPNYELRWWRFRHPTTTTHTLCVTSQLKDERKPRNLKDGLRQATASTANQGGNCKTLLALR